MSKRTPWAQSSLLSDRVKPQSNPATAPKNKGKAKEGAVQQPPRSAAVRTIETTIKKLQSGCGEQKDPKWGCFCLARTHQLSPYHPLCYRCGLILCSLNPPYHACPHCSRPLLSQTTKDMLLERLQADLSDTIAKEEEEANRLREEARQAAGAFPSLTDGDTIQQKQQNQRAQPHKVLSLNSKTKRVTVASYAPAPAPVFNSTRPESPKKEESPERVPPPSSENLISRKRPDAGRPWMDVRGDGFVRSLTYVPDQRIIRGQLKEERKARKLKEKRDAGQAIGGDDGASAGTGKNTANS